MPVLTKFENSAMKASFSLSSLRPSSVGLESPEHVRLRAERPYNSLTKKRKEPEKENWRRSWGTTSSREECKDDFWAALQANYNYIMDNHLIESCTETNGELMRNITDAWSFKEFLSQFSELYSWLNSIQETVYSKDENTKNKSLCACQDELEHRAHRRVAFTEQASRLMQTFPEVKDEVSWRLAHLNTKWDAVQQAVSLAIPQESGTDVEHEVRCLRQWMREMESRLQPLSFRQDWSLQELEEKALEHMVLQRDIESHGKVVSSVVKLCETERRRSTPPVQTPRRSRRAARCRGRTALALERRWHLLFLRSLEWQCHIETLAQQLAANNSDRLYGVCVDSDEEPVLKQPRLSAPASCHRVHSSSSESERQFTDSSDEGSYFEDGIEQTCSLINNVIEMDCTLSPKPDTSQSDKKMEKVNRTPVTNGTDRKISNSSQRNTTPKEKKRKNRVLEDCTHVTKIDYKSPNNVTYYCKHNETDSGDTEMQTVDESSEDEWTYTDHQNVVNKVESTQNEDECKPTEDDSNTNEPLHHSTPDSSKSKSLIPTRLDFVSRIPSSPKLSKDELNRLVMNAEILANTPAKVRKQRSYEPNKHHRVKEWLNRSNSDSSDTKVKAEEQCDASGEYTTEESDAEHESQSSEDLNESVATFRQINNEACRSQNNSSEVIATIDSSINDSKSFLVPSESSSTKVNLRPKRANPRKNRPWSVASISALSSQKLSKQNKETLSHFSISESALHELDMASLLSKPTCNIARVNSNTSCQLTESSKHGHLRKQKLVHFRKRSINRKSESGLDNLHNSPFVLSMGSKNRLSPSYNRILVKSGSFSGSMTTKPSVSDRCTASDPSNNNYVSTTSGGDTEDEKKISLSPKLLTEQSTVLMFQLGPTAEISNNAEIAVEGRDSSPEKTSLTTATTEEPLSLSEWDNYYEKYMSEPYSETPDSEAARRLLDFGEDYRNYIDSQSDCCSSMSTHTQGHELSPVPVRRRHKPSPQNTLSSNSSSTIHRSLLQNNTAFDSESDFEEFKHVIMESRYQLELTDNVFMKQITSGGDPPSVSSILQHDYAQIIATCQENLKCLQVLIKCQGNSLSTSEFHNVKDLVGSWSFMLSVSTGLQRAKNLEQQIIALSSKLKTISECVTVHNMQSIEEAAEKMNMLKGELMKLEHCKMELLHVNVGVHRFLTDTGIHVHNPIPSEAQEMMHSQSTDPRCREEKHLQLASLRSPEIRRAATYLKDNVVDLYRHWTETSENVSAQITQLERVLGIWTQFEDGLFELRGDLRGDGTTLRKLDNALQGGPVSPDVATSVRNVAKVLSEKPAGQTGKNVKSSPDITTQDCDKNHTYGSGWGSDSGISDEGSEQDLSERERRLAALHRLARQLKGVLAPNCQALVDVSVRMFKTETELRDLQRFCRALIVRTAVCAEVNSRKQDVLDGEINPELPVTSTNQRKSKCVKRVPATSVADNDPESDPGHSRSWLWRVLQASLPCQLAILALFCVACLLEPHCCDRTNNMTMSFSPQLRYIKGPPPI